MKQYEGLFWSEQFSGGLDIGLGVTLVSRDIRPEMPPDMKSTRRQIVGALISMVNLSPAPPIAAET